MPETKKNTIHIDTAVYHLEQDSITGEELRKLPVPPIGEDRDLYLTVPGPDNDIAITNSYVVNLKSGMHFFTAPRTITPG
jgi:hypothetical protein